jgi:hypothetical protein
VRFWLGEPKFTDELQTMATTFDGVLASAGLSAFSEALTSAGADSLDSLAALPEETLLSPVIGMRKLHVNKLFKALQAIGAAPGPPPPPPPQAEAKAVALLPPSLVACSLEAQVRLPTQHVNRLAKYAYQ